jgi:hypothetical protein
MALIKCSDCGRDVSSNAVACPQCGNPIAFENASAIMDEMAAHSGDFAGQPVVSNIQDAISYMRKEVERHGAVIEASALSGFAELGSFMTNLILLGIIPFFASLIITVIWFNSTKGLGILFIPIYGLLIWGFLIMIFAWLSNTFTTSQKIKAKLDNILPDLETLFKYNPNMDVGFQLDGRGHFDEDVLKAMMKKREQEIRRQAGS